MLNLYITVHEFEAAKLGEIIEMQKVKYYKEMNEIKKKHSEKLYEMSSKLLR